MILFSLIFLHMFWFTPHSFESSLLFSKIWRVMFVCICSYKVLISGRFQWVSYIIFGYHYFCLMWSIFSKRECEVKYRITRSTEGFCFQRTLFPSFFHWDLGIKLNLLLTSSLPLISSSTLWPRAPKLKSKATILPQTPYPKAMFKTLGLWTFECFINKVTHI